MKQGLRVPGGFVSTAKIYKYLVIFVVHYRPGARYDLSLRPQYCVGFENRKA